MLLVSLLATNQNIRKFLELAFFFFERASQLDVYHYKNKSAPNIIPLKLRLRSLFVWNTAPMEGSNLKHYYTIILHHTLANS